MKITVTSTSNTIPTSMLFNNLLSNAHHTHKSKVQSKKITDFINSSVLTTSVSDMDDSLDELLYFHDKESMSENGQSNSSPASNHSDDSLDGLSYLLDEES